MKIQTAEIRGMNTESGIICSECMTDEDWKGLTGNDVITADELEKADDNYFFCDRCDKQL